MPINRSVLMRIRTIDACLRRRNRLWTIEDLRQACEDALYDYEGIDSVSLRTVQRDIELMRSDKLGYYAPIVVKERKYYTYADPTFSITQLPLSEWDLAELSSAIDILKNYQGFATIQGQEDVLTRMQDQVQMQRSQRQIVFIETNSQLKGLHLLSPLYEYIRRQEAIVLHYHSFRSQKESVFYLSPYILNEYNNRWFLLAYSKRWGLMTLALDRMLSVERDANGTYVENSFFEPEKYLGEMIGVTRNLQSKTVRVVLRFDNDQAPYVLTKPLHKSQEVIDRSEDGGIVVALHVVHNLELEGKILAFGRHVEVLLPRLLRRRIAESLRVAADKYLKEER